MMFISLKSIERHEGQLGRGIAHEFPLACEKATAIRTRRRG